MFLKTIGFFNSTKEWGGGEKWHHDMALQMHKDEYDTIVFANRRGELFKRLKKNNIHIEPVSVSNLSFLNVFKLIRLSKYFKQKQISHLIINDPSDLKFAGLAAKFAKVEHIIYRRGSAIPIGNSFSNRWIFKYIVTEIIANTEATKKTINQNYKLFPEDKIKVIYNGICLDTFDKFAYEIKQKNEQKLIIGNIGRLVEQKAQYLLIELAKLLKNRGLDFKIIIGGKGKLEQDLKTLRDNYGLTDEVEFTGFVNNSKKFLMNIDLFVLTSQWEGFGYVLVEAMACKKPVFAFNLSSNPEIIDDKKTGFLIENKNIEELADQIIKLSNNKQKMIEFGEKGRAKVEELFSFKSAYKNFTKFILQKI